MIEKAAGEDYNKGGKRLSFEEWRPIYERLSKEAVNGWMFIL